MKTQKNHFLVLRLSFLVGVMLLLSVVVRSQSLLQKAVDFTQTYEDRRHSDHRHRTPGYVVVLVDGENSKILSFGALEREKNKRPSAHTLFPIGDAACIELGIGFMNALERKNIAITTPVSSLLDPDEYGNWTQEVTLLDLLRHRSPLPRVLANSGQYQTDQANPYASISDSFFLQALKNLPQQSAHSYSYSPYNYVLLEHLMPLPDPLITQKTNTATFYAGSEQPAPPWDAGAFRSVLGIEKSGLDLLADLHFWLNLAPTFWQSLHDAAIPTGIRKNTWSTVGWHRIRVKRKRHIFAHVGTTSGSRCFLAVDPSTKTGVAVLSNSPYGMHGLGHNLLRILNQNWRR